MGPAAFRRLVTLFPENSNAQLPARILTVLDALTELFWDEHQALPHRPLWNYVRGNTVSARIHALLDATPDGDPGQ